MICSIYEPMYAALRVVDTEVVPTLGMMYNVFESMVSRLSDLQGKQWVVDIVTERWKKQLHHPLHEAAHWLNPRLQYNPNVEMRSEYMQMVTRVYDKLHQHEDYIDIWKEVSNCLFLISTLITCIIILGRTKLKFMYCFRCR